MKLIGWKTGLTAFMGTGQKLIRMTENTEIEEAAEAIADFAGVDTTQLSGSTWQKVLEILLPAIRKLAWNLAACAIIFFIGNRLIAFLLKTLDKALERAKVEIGVSRFLHSVIRVLLYVLLLFIMAAQLGINTTSIFTILGAAGLAVAMSLQGSLSNLAGGILILLMRPFRVGDYISTSFGDGTVNMIGMVYTSITTIDNRVITIPNGELSNSAVTNITANPERRLDLTFSIDYGADLRKAKEVLENVLRNDPDVLKDKEMLVFVDSLADSAVIIGTIAWVPSSRYLFAKRAILEEGKLRLDEAGVKIPFPQMDVHLDGGK